MKANKKEEEKRERVSISTFYDVGDGSPYIVKYYINGRERKKIFSTKFFATLQAKRVAKKLGIRPDLSFEPIID